MKKSSLFVVLSLLLSVAFIPCGVQKVEALPDGYLNPSVPYSKPNFAYSPPLRKFVNSLPGLGSGARPAGSALGANDLNQYLPMATPDQTTFPGCDYYEIALVDYTERMHGDLPAGGTKLRGYVQEISGVQQGIPHYLGPLIIATKGRPVRVKFVNRIANGAAGNLFLPVDGTLMGAGLGPKFANGTDCNPATQACASYTQNRADLHLHGGLPPWISDGTAYQWITPAGETTPYVKGASQQNAPDMWYDATTRNIVASCAGHTTCAVANSTTTPAGVITYYWPNTESGRLLFFHDHAVGITRLNVYAGEAAGYLLNNPVEEDALHTAGVPGTIGSTPAATDLGHLVPLVIQDKTFVYDTTVNPVGITKDPTHFTAATDPLWDSVNWGGGGNLWFPHVYIPNQDPTDITTGANPLGRWDYGPWFWPIFPAATPYPPTVSHVPESFMDTPIVNGTAYPYLDVAPAKYRLRILNACNDRMLNLQMYVADSNYTTAATATATVLNGVVTGLSLTSRGSGYTPNSSPMVHIYGGGGYGAWATATVSALGDVSTLSLTNGGAGYSSAPSVAIGGNKEVKMVPAVPSSVCTSPTVPNVPAGCFPASWTFQTPGMTPDILDSRLSGVPDPAFRGPAMIQIGTEGGLLPVPALLLNTPVGYEQNKRNIVVLNVAEKTLMLAAAERADVVVDFTNFAGKTVILYNDSPAPVPAGDPRYDFYTGNPDYSITGGANYQGGSAPTNPGYGPNTRTIMQFRVSGTGGTAPVDDYDPALLTALQNVTTGLPAVFKANLDIPIVPESAYNTLAYTGGATTDTYAKISDLSLTFTPYGTNTSKTVPMKNKTIQELFDMEGRMNATLGVELPFTNAGIQTTVPLGFFDPVTDQISAGKTQLWKITHNGVDTHGIHFHLVNVQIINRVGWDGAIRPPDDNELGWKETVRMNPLEDIIVAMRAKVPPAPFPVPDSIRPVNPTIPVGAMFNSFDPLTGLPTTIPNTVSNFGHEFVWHCHILGHEENDMMRPFVLTYRPPQGNFMGGPTDFAIWRPSTNQWYVKSAFNGQTSTTALGATGDKLVPGDYDGDYKTDMAVWTPASGTWTILSSITNLQNTVVWGANGDIPVPADYDGDGKTDIAVYRPTDGNWYIKNTSTNTNSIVTWGVSTDIPVPGDYDGDGKADIAVYRPSAGTWYIVNSSTGSFTVRTWGTSTDITVPGDYDGDGKTDIAVYRPSNGTWYIINSSTGATSVVQWGTAGDIPVPGDYDNTGKTEIAVFRPSNGNWYVKNTSNNSNRIVQWGAGTDQPVKNAQPVQ